MKRLSFLMVGILSIFIFASLSPVGANQLDSHEQSTQSINSENMLAPSSDEELIGIDIIDFTNMENSSGGCLAFGPTSSFYLSYSSVEQIFKNLNNISGLTNILGTFLGLKNPILGIIVGYSGNQNPNFRNAITKAYYQGKRVKIVTEYGASMSLNKVYYYVVN